MFITITPRIPAAGRTGALEAGETETEAKMKNRRPNRHKTQKTQKTFEDHQGGRQLWGAGGAIVGE